ncbi:MAG: NUDIX hydrolase, partial [Clostridia bacterium]|nr:NUDIX hydrolase [Clostridia bacterium]
MNLSEKKLKGKTIYDGKILKLEVDEVQLPDGSMSVRECVRHHGGAAVLLVDSGKVLLVKQFRYLYGKELYEIPAGKLEKGEEAIKAAARELEEETGYRAKLVRLFELYPSVGYTDEVIHVFLAEKFEYVGRKLDEGEFLECEFIEVEKVLKLIESGEICDAKTVAAVYA